MTYISLNQEKMVQGKRWTYTSVYGLEEWSSVVIWRMKVDRMKKRNMSDENDMTGWFDNAL